MPCGSVSFNKLHRTLILAGYPELNISIERKEPLVTYRSLVIDADDDQEFFVDEDIDWSQVDKKIWDFRMWRYSPHMKEKTAPAEHSYYRRVAIKTNTNATVSDYQLAYETEQARGGPEGEELDQYILDDDYVLHVSLV